MPLSSVSLTTFTTCGELLKFLRRRVQLSQRELSIAVGYSESHISRLENGERPIDTASLLALFVPALHLQDEPEIVARLLALCAEHPIAPAIQSLTTPAPLFVSHPLPIPLTSFIGRKEEVAEVRELLQQTGVRLLTLTGAGGCGKTRLALSVGVELAHQYENGVRLVELAPLGDPQLLAHTVATVFGLSKVPIDASLASLTDLLYPQQTLLILDNCEHLVDAVAHLALKLLQACPQLQILATSREALAVPGEFNYRVQPLALPPSQRGVQPLCAEIEAYDAIQLFVERARTPVRTFALTDQNAPAVARICQRLDGIPLGIELAAAWVYLLSPAQIADRLEQNFDLLIGGGRTALPRHQTMRAAIDWSYNLLSEPEQALLRRLSVFIGGWRLDAADAVAADAVATDAVATDAVATDAANQPSLLTGSQVVTLLNQLANKSIVVVEHSESMQTRVVKSGDDAPVNAPAHHNLDGRLEADERRYRLLESLREYGQAELVKANEAEQVRNRHLTYFTALAEAVDAELEVHPLKRWLTRLEQEQENLRAALNWSLVHNRSDEGLRLATALGRFWRHSGTYTEGRQWLRVILAQNIAPSPLRGRALLWAGTLARLQRDFAEAQRLSEECLQLATQGDDQIVAGLAFENMGWIYSDTEQDELAVSYFQQALARFRAAGSVRRSARLLTTLAQVARRLAQFDLAREQLLEALDLVRTADDPQGIGQTLSGLSELAALAGDYDQTAQLLSEALGQATISGSKQDLAWAYCGLSETCWHLGDDQAALRHGELSLQLFQELGSVRGQAIVWHHLGLAQLALGNLAEATQYLHSSLQQCQAVQLTFMKARCLAGQAAIAIRRGEMAWAAQMLAVATTCFTAYSHQLTPADEAFYDRQVEACRTQLDHETFALAWAAGKARSITETFTFNAERPSVA